MAGHFTRGSHYHRVQNAFIEYSPRIAGALRAMGASPQEVEDALQESVLQVMQREGIDDVGPYLRRTAINAFIGMRKKRKSQTALEDRVFNDRTECSVRRSVRTPESHVVISEKVEEALEDLLALPRAQREVFVMRVEGMDYAEIAEVTGRSQAAVRQNMHRAEQALKAMAARERKQSR